HGSIATRRRCRSRACSRAAPGLPAARQHMNAAVMVRHRSRGLGTARYFKEIAMEGVTIVDHPLVQHKLTLIRDKSISTKSFRELLKEIGMLLCYEVTRDLPLAEVVIETPMAQMQSAKIAGKKLVFVPVLRAGVTFVDGMMDLVPTARVAHIGLYGEPQTLV